MTTTFPPDWRQRVDAFVTDWLSDQRVPGAALAVVDGDSVVHAAGYGARDLATNTPATPRTLYGVASVTKSFAAQAVLQQVARTDLALDDPVSDHVPFFEDLDDPPTVHELLTHSSGIPSDGAGVALIARLTGADPIEIPLSSDADLRRHVAGAADDRAAGERFFYYNTGYVVLGKLVEALDGRPFGEYLADEVLRPLGMERSCVAPSTLDSFDDVMTPYRTVDGERVETPFPGWAVGAPGGLLASMAELGEFLAFNLAPTADVLPPDLLEAAHAAHVTQETYLDGEAQGYGYGWMRRPFLDDELVGHAGSLVVSTAYVGFLEDAGIGVAIACNDSPEVHPRYVGPAILAMLSGAEPTATRFFALRERAERVAGTYESYRGVQTATVEPAGGHLAVTLETALGTEQFEAQPASRDGDLVYHATAPGGAREPLEFVPGDEGLDLFFRRWRLRGTSG